MNILIYGVSAWNDTNSFGNTISNWFCGNEWKNDNFSNFYNRSQLPDNKAAVHYCCLTSVDIIKGLFKGKIKGRTFSSDELQRLGTKAQSNARSERSVLDYIHSHNVRWVYWADDLLWMSKIWLNRYFKDFVQSENPDIFFAFAHRPAILWPVISYIKKHTACKTVLFVADDVKSCYRGATGCCKRHFLKNCIGAADKLYAVSEEMSAAYSNYYGKPISVLYKGCDLSLPPRDELNRPKRMVYAGNLSHGRDTTLSAVAEALKKVNADGIRASLEIYSTATITEELDKKLNIKGSSRLMGSRPYDEITEILHEADIVLHVESFEQKSIDEVRYSLSTKIADCLQSGTFVLGIGPKNIASIEYLRKVDGTFVIDKTGEIESKLREILFDDRMISENIKKTRNYALTHQELGLTRRKLRNDLKALLG